MSDNADRCTDCLFADARTHRPPGYIKGYPPGVCRYWAIFEGLRGELGYADYALQH